MPHFSYFLLAVDQIYAGVVLSLLAEEDLLIVDRNGPFFQALLPDNDTLNQDAVIPDRTALVNKLVSFLEPVIACSREVFDDSGPLLHYLLQGSPENVRDKVLEDLSFGVR